MSLYWNAIRFSSPYFDTWHMRRDIAWISLRQQETLNFAVWFFLCLRIWLSARRGFSFPLISLTPKAHRAARDVQGNSRPSLLFPAPRLAEAGECVFVLWWHNWDGFSLALFFGGKNKKQKQGYQKKQTHLTVPFEERQSDDSASGAFMALHGLQANAPGLQACWG